MSQVSFYFLLRTLFALGGDAQLIVMLHRRLYCECFRNGKVCNANECGCVSCKNTIANSGPHGIRTKTITEILRRRPDAFEKRERTQEGCRCKKNQCLKKYCV